MNTQCRHCKQLLTHRKGGVVRKKTHQTLLLQICKHTWISIHKGPPLLIIVRKELTKRSLVKYYTCNKSLPNNQEELVDAHSGNADHSGSNYPSCNTHCSENKGHTCKHHHAHLQCTRNLNCHMSEIHGIHICTKL